MDLVDKILELSGQGFFCSQILMLLALEAEGKTDPDLIRAVGGLNGGLGFSGEVCGCLTGGCCLLSYFLGKGEAEEFDDPETRETIANFVRWFKSKTNEEYGGTACNDITCGNTALRLEHCPGIIGDTFEKCVDILTDKGVL